MPSEKKLILLKRSIGPVRDLIHGILRSENDLIQEKTEKYFKDVYDHIIQANDLAENYRDVMINLQDLYMSNVNLKQIRGNEMDGNCYLFIGTRNCNWGNLWDEF